MSGDPVADFFRACELAASGAPAAERSDLPDWLQLLADASAAELAFDTAGARALLARARPLVPDGPFSHVLGLIDLRVEVRDANAESVAGSVARLEQLLDALPEGERATRARTLHLLSIAHMRLGRVEAAEDSIADALALIDDAPVRAWMADTAAQLLIAQGAWCEAVRTLDALVAHRRTAGDPLGQAISAGHLSRLHTQLGRPERGAAIAREALAGLAGDAPRLTRVRLHTLILNALLDYAEPPEIVEASHALEGLLESGATPHYLRGHAMLSLARAVPDLAAAREWLSRAAHELTLPGDVALLRYHEASVDPALLGQAEWLAGVSKMLAATDVVSEAEIRLLLLRAARACEDGQRRDMHALLGVAHKRAMQSNNPLWMRWVDESTAQLDPDKMSDRIARRFSGRSRRELSRTKREEATIIFADLVNFTPRALELLPEEVMDTVRGLFELGVPLLTKHRVTPISYMGDGLLALCQGDDHHLRGLSFARDLVARAGRMSRLRRTLSGWPLDLRAGVASGPVVLGALGTLFKTEFAAIGFATNLAARLQSKAEPGEVLCSARTARAARLDLPEETMQLKGFEKWDQVETCRIRVYTPS